MNYETLIIAGYGTIGSSLIQLGKETLSLFNSIIAIDKDFTHKPMDTTDTRLDFITGDIEDPEFLTDLCRHATAPVLLLNVATGTDNVRIRKIISPFDIAYLDSCASSLPDKTECRFSRYMPYTFTPISSRYPHWLCWGINPGLVEVMARKLIREIDAHHSFDVTVYEHDQLDATGNANGVAVGWSPDMLIEEMMISPTLQIQEGESVEQKTPGATRVTAYWDGKPVPSRIVGHEDIWNIGQLDSVKAARFIYGLHPKVMRLLDGDPEKALKQLKVPDESVRITGMERVAVCVERIGTGEKRSVVWETDHEVVWKTLGVNAVQYQTGKSLLLAMMLMQETSFGRKPYSACASDLPLEPRDWDVIERFMKDLNICWTDASDLKLYAE